MCTADIVYLRKDAVYGAGEHVSGTVVLNLIDPQSPPQLVLLTMRGGSSVEWSQKWTVSGDSKTVKYVSRRTYVKEQVTLWDSEDSALSPGVISDKKQHKFSFSCTLPESCATSFEGGKVAHIRYHCEVFVRTAKTSSLVCVKPFSVIGFVDLRETDAAKLGGRKRLTKQLGGGCCGMFGKNGNVILDVSIPRLAFVAGEVIPCNVQITNNSSQRVQYTKAQLFQHVTYRGSLIGSPATSRSAAVPLEHKVHGTPKIVMEVCWKIPVEPGQTCGWNNEGILIPAIPPKLCSPDIEISYHLVYEAVIGSFAEVCTAQFPITIGTYPRSLVYLPDHAIPQINSITPVKAQLIAFRVTDTATQASAINRSHIFSPRYAYLILSPKQHIYNILTEFKHPSNENGPKKSWQKIADSISKSARKYTLA